MKRTTMDNEASKGRSKPVSVAEYRKLLNDHESTEEKIQERLNYLEALCRNIIRGELDKMKNSRKSSDKNALKTSTS